MSTHTTLIPEELRERRQWVVWGIPNRPPKAPHQPDGSPASSTDPSTWSTFEDAVAAVESGRAEGIGFVFSEGDPYVGIDLDHCIDPETEKWEPFASAIVKNLDSWTEISPSGTGLHIIVKGELPPGRRRDGVIEMYDRARYFTVTGNVISHGPDEMIMDRTVELTELHAQLFPDDEPDNGPSPAPEPVHDLDDRALLERAQKAKNGGTFSRLWAGQWEGAYPSQSEADAALCSMLAFWTGRDGDRMDRLFRRSGLIRPKWDRNAQSDGTTYGQLTIDRAIRSCGEVYTPRPGRNGSTPFRDGHQSSDGKATIIVTTDIPEVVSAAERALLDERAELYQRAGFLVRVRREEGEPPAIETVPRPALREAMADAADWVRLLSEGEEKPVLPPVWAVKALESRGAWRFPKLTAIVESPTLRPDGSVLSTAGLDPATGLLYIPTGESFPSIPPAPSREEAMSALADLEDVLCDFPFVADCDRSAAIAATLTPVARHAIDGPCPMFLFRAPAAGTGKGLLCDTVTTIALGRRPALYVQPRDDDEARKRITSIAISGTPAVLIDNIERPLGSASLAAALTTTRWSDRILGKSEVVTLPLTTVFFGTGNNTLVQGDCQRRVIPIDQDAEMERPDERSGWRYPNLLAYVRRHRPRLLTAALTILKAHTLAGRPGGEDLKAFGSYEQWSSVIRACCVWLGLPDPCEGRRRIRRSDPEAEAQREVLHAWDESFGREPVLLADMQLRASERLKVALAGLYRNGDPKRLDTRTLGYKLRRLSDRPRDGLCLRSLESTYRGRPWQVVRLTGNDPDDGDSLNVHRQASSGSSSGSYPQSEQGVAAKPDEPDDKSPPYACEEQGSEKKKNLKGQNHRQLRQDVTLSPCHERDSDPDDTPDDTLTIPLTMPSKGVAK